MPVLCSSHQFVHHQYLIIGSFRSKQFNRPIENVHIIFFKRLCFIEMYDYLQKVSK